MKSSTIFMQIGEDSSSSSSSFKDIIDQMLLPFPPCLKLGGCFYISYKRVMKKFKF